MKISIIPRVNSTCTRSFASEAHAGCKNEEKFRIDFLQICLKMSKIDKKILSPLILRNHILYSGRRTERKFDFALLLFRIILL